MTSDSDIPDRDDVAEILAELEPEHHNRALLCEILEALRLIEAVLVTLNDNVVELNRRRT